MATIITQETLDTVINSQAPAVVLDVYAPWCGPCQQMMPVITALEAELGASCVFVKLNVDDAHETAIKYGVSSVPTFIFFKNGVMVAKETGYMGKQVLREKIQLFLGV